MRIELFTTIIFIACLLVAYKKRSLDKESKNESFLRSNIGYPKKEAGH